MTSAPRLSAAQFPRDAAAAREAFRVSWARRFATKLALSYPSMALRLGNWESALLAERLRPIRVDRPIYIAGLARSGSTALLESIAALPGVASQQYRDFPWVFTPVWWNEFLRRAPRRKTPPRPRVHADGLAVSPESPEALEEPLWLAAFASPCTAKAIEQWRRGSAVEPFAGFYRRHVQKLLLVRGGNRYACKGNYHVARLEYLLELFPDARFVIPIRGPVEHVASLAKQHRLFVAGESTHPRALAQMEACGHFEFGLGRRAIVLDDPATAESVTRLWNSGEDARGWARYWAHLYGYLARRLRANPLLAKATLVVLYEDLCQRSAETVRRLMDHCGLKAGGELCDAIADWLRGPSYYEPQFAAEELAAIKEETDAVAAQFGYERAGPRATERSRRHAPPRPRSACGEMK